MGAKNLINCSPVEGKLQHQDQMVLAAGGYWHSSGANTTTAPGAGAAGNLAPRQSAGAGQIGMA